jgi:hypothetical protein
MFYRLGSNFICDAFDGMDAVGQEQSRPVVAGDGACTECSCERFISDGHGDRCGRNTCYHFYKAHR